jgi:hypothetical protein
MRLIILRNFDVAEFVPTLFHKNMADISTHEVRESLELSAGKHLGKSRVDASIVYLARLKLNPRLHLIPSEINTGPSTHLWHVTCLYRMSRSSGNVVFRFFVGDSSNSSAPLPEKNKLSEVS